LKAAKHVIEQLHVSSHKIVGLDLSAFTGSVLTDKIIDALNFQD